MADTCSKLEEIGNATRAELLLKNIYQDQSGLQYSVTHLNATQAKGGIDDQNNAKGKGTGIKWDTSNGGSDIDVYGDPTIINTGRVAIYNENQYNPDKKYDCFAN